MSDTTIIIICGLVGLAIWSWLLYEMIFAASYGRKMWVLQQKQTKILIEMAKKAGVHEGTIAEITDDRQYKFRGY